MFHRIEVDVIHVALQVLFVANEMFPIATLPDATLPSRHPLRTPALVDWKPTRESALDLRPSISVVRIARGQPPEAMKVIRKDHDRNDFEWSYRMRGMEGCSQIDDVLDQQPPTSLQQIDCEEIGAAWHLRAKVIRHSSKLAQCPPKRNRPDPQRYIRKAPATYRNAHTQKVGQGPPYKLLRAAVGRAQARLTRVDCHRKNRFAVN